MSSKPKQPRDRKTQLRYLPIVPPPSGTPQNPVLRLIHGLFTSNRLVPVKACGNLLWQPNIVWIEKDPTVSDLLWHGGCFGKGILSRSEPTWWNRRSAERHLLEYAARLNHTEGDDNADFLREVERESSRLHGISRQERSQIAQNVVRQLRQHRDANNADITNRVDFDTDSWKVAEALQLTPFETIFLTWALGVLDVRENETRLSGKDLWHRFMQDGQAHGAAPAMIWEDSGVPRNAIFAVLYAVYHHYRSHKWIVKSGIKYGVDFLLYSKSPMFTHAEHAVLVIPRHCDSTTGILTFAQLLKIHRVAGSVKKRLTLCYVTVPTEIDFSSASDPKTILTQFEVTDVIWSRWLPQRSRNAVDVK
ncbi:hypothetical protein BJ742DRAFT_820581 [Cladochytrium replicatum]|nr:hypothetical protein BJ742DRAFT_820581 [Cladochytrium replicatum]